MVESVGVVAEVVGLGVGVIIQEDRSGCDAMAGPGVDTALGGSRLGTLDVVVCSLVLYSVSY